MDDRIRRVCGVQMLDSDNPWRGRQPKYDRIVRIAPDRFGLATKLPDGRPIVAELGSSFPPAGATVSVASVVL